MQDLALPPARNSQPHVLRLLSRLPRRARPPSCIAPLSLCFRIMYAVCVCVCMGTCVCVCVCACDVCVCMCVGVDERLCTCVCAHVLAYTPHCVQTCSKGEREGKMEGQERVKCAKSRSFEYSFNTHTHTNTVIRTRTPWYAHLNAQCLGYFSTSIGRLD
jgi:hypothetical protein